jgi:hypothetical protein
MTLEVLAMGIGDMYKAQIDAEEAKRFRWWFSPGDIEGKQKFVLPYIDGCTAGWTLDQWRVAVDAAMAGIPFKATERTSEGKS